MNVMIRKESGVSLQKTLATEMLHRGKQKQLSTTGAKRSRKLNQEEDQKENQKDSTVPATEAEFDVVEAVGEFYSNLISLARARFRL
jgi:hypothetical protein